MRFWPPRRHKPATPSTSPAAQVGTAEVQIKWSCEVQKFKACWKHDGRNPDYQPFDPACPDCVITEPPIEATVHEPQRGAP